MPLTLDVDLRAYVPAFERIGSTLPVDTVTTTNIAELREVTGLTWEPATEPHYRARKIGAGMEAFEKVPDFKYVTRGAGGPILGSAGKGYTLFPNGALFGVAEAIGVAALEAKRTFRFLSGGELAGGKRVYLLADLGEPHEVRGDPSPYVRYVTLLSSHNGRGAVKVLGTQLRWFCTNALHAAEMQAAAQGAAFSFRHTTNLEARVEHARRAITAAVVHHDRMRDRVQEMLATRVKPEAVSAYLREFALAQVVSKGDPLKRPEVGSGLTQHEQAVDRLEGEVRVIYESKTCEGIRDTAYGPFAAIGEYLDNVRPYAGLDSLFERTMVNTERGKSLAYALARQAF